MPVDEYLRVAEAVLRVFNKSDELRKNIMMARIKVLVDRIGMDAFRQRVEEELKEDWAKEPIDPTPYLLNDYKPIPAPIATNGHNGTHEDARPRSCAGRNRTSLPSGRPAYSVVQIMIPQGDIFCDDFDKLADVARRFGNGQMRTTFDQNLALRWVPDDKLQDLWKALGGIGFGAHGVGEITDVTSCPGRIAARWESRRPWA